MNVCVCIDGLVYMHTFPNPVYQESLEAASCKENNRHILVSNYNSAI